MRAKDFVPPPLRPAARSLYFRIYRAAVRAQCWYRDRVDRRQLAGGLTAPPALLRFRVGGAVSLTEFLTVGDKTAEHIASALGSVGRSLDDFAKILDFGCGCGRTLIFLARRCPRAQFHGTDVDVPSIDWCRAHLPFAHFSVNGVLPPVSYADASFDFIYAISVFTHLGEEQGFLWLEELRRILKPGGLLLLSVHGEASWKALPPGDIEHLRRHGFLFKTSSKLSGIVPEWYHTAFHASAYVKSNFSKTFDVLAYLDAGLGYQDLAVLQRRLSS